MNLLIENCCCMKFHFAWINKLILIENGDIVSCSDDLKIIVFDSIFFKEKLQINIFENIITYIENILNNCIIATSQKIMKIIKLSNSNTKYEIIQNIILDSLIFKAIPYKNEYLVSCSNNSYLYFYKKNNLQFNLIKEINTQTGAITSLLELSNNEIVSLSYSSKLLIFWDINSLNEKARIGEIRCEYISLHDSIIQLNNKFLAVGLDENGILLINYISHTIEKKLINNTKTYTTLNILKNGFLFVTCCYKHNSNRKYKFIDIELYKIEENFNLNLIGIKKNVHYEPISSCIELNNGNILSGSYDQTIKEWKIMNKNIFKY